MNTSMSGIPLYQNFKQVHSLPCSFCGQVGPCPMMSGSDPQGYTGRWILIPAPANGADTKVAEKPDAVD
jgi:hypothetical protein